MMAARPSTAISLRCPVCGKHLCWADGVYCQPAPCACGWQTTVEAVGKQARRTVQTPAGAIEVKAR